MRNAYKILVRIPVGKRPVGSPIHRWNDNIKMDWRCAMIHLAQDRDQWPILVEMVMNVCVPQHALNFLCSSITVSFSKVLCSMDVVRIIIHISMEKGMKFMSYTTDSDQQLRG
jgi:hypothetical protein